MDCYAFGLKIAHSEFHIKMNDIFNPISKFTIVYIDDVLVFSKSLDQHFKHVNIFLSIKLKEQQINPLN
uniref:Reverse transcriptase domain-containing protein n=1 Tax=Medicago truncatula TaxID=3880 RepID=A2Q4L8_MEDTR|nr:hypothetical protein MtrDRAFT_AC157504g38v2 [Medicago truncatula]